MGSEGPRLLSHVLSNPCACLGDSGPQSALRAACFLKPPLLQGPLARLCARGEVTRHQEGGGESSLVHKAARSAPVDEVGRQGGLVLAPTYCVKRDGNLYTTMWSGPS